MAVIFSKNSGLNDGLWKDIDRALIAVMQDTDNEKNNDDELVKSLFNVKKSQKFAERVTGLTGFANFDIVEEGADAPLDDLQESYSKLIQHKQFMKKFICTAEMAEDADIDTMKTASANFIRAYKRSRAKFASEALVSSAATFTYGGKSLDKTTGDGEALFSKAHKSKKGGGTQCNVLRNPFGTDGKALYRIANFGRNFKNDSGEGIHYFAYPPVLTGKTPDAVMVPALNAAGEVELDGEGKPVMVATTVEDIFENYQIKIELASRQEAIVEKDYSEPILKERIVFKLGRLTPIEIRLSQLGLL